MGNKPRAAPVCSDDEVLQRVENLLQECTLLIHSIDCKEDPCTKVARVLAIIEEVKRTELTLSGLVKHRRLLDATKAKLEEFQTELKRHSWPKKA